MAAKPVAIAVRPERHKRLRRGEKIAHPSRMDSGIAPSDHSALMVAHQDSQLHRNRLVALIRSDKAFLIASR
jgi:hypothetical protein